MEKTLEIIKEILNNEYISKIIIALITGIITHFFTMRKIKREKTIKYKAELGNKIGNAYIELREIISKLTSIEIYTNDNRLPTTDNILIPKQNAVYPSFMSTYNSLCDCLREISNARAKHEDFLDIPSASMLYCLERYLLSLTYYIAEQGLVNNCDFIGCIAIVDIQKIQRNFDVLLVKRINKPSFKLFYKKSILWKLRKKWVEKLYLEKSYLNKLITGSIVIPNDVLLELIELNNRGEQSSDTP